LAEVALRALPSVPAALMSYGPDLNVRFALAANYVDRIAKGAKTIKMPVEQPNWPDYWDARLVREEIARR
jgi:hypothetical protein